MEILHNLPTIFTPHQKALYVPSPHASNQLSKSTKIISVKAFQWETLLSTIPSWAMVATFCGVCL